MINIAIVDDEDIQLRLLSDYLADWALNTKNIIEIKTFTSAEAFLFNGNSFDITILDIQMQGKSGIELAHEIRKNNTDTVIIFITGVSDYIAEGYEVSALHYLIKPVKKEKLFDVMNKAVDRIEKTDRYIIVSTDEENVRINLKDILYIEVFAHTIEIHSKTKTIITKSSLTALEKELDESFVRANRSCIVGLRYINRITKTEVILDNGASVPLSRRMYNDVNQSFISLFKEG